MAFFKNYLNDTVSQENIVDRAKDSLRNENGTSSFNARGIDMNVDAQYQSDGEQYDARTIQNTSAAGNGVGVNNLHPSPRRTVDTGKWGSTFWKDCQPMCLLGGSDSGQDSRVDRKINMLRDLMIIRLVQGIRLSSSAGRSTNKDEVWDAEASEEEEENSEDVDVSDEDPCYSKKPKGKQGSKRKRRS